MRTMRILLMTKITRIARKNTTHYCAHCECVIVAGSRYVDMRRASMPGLAFRFHEGCLMPRPASPMSDTDFNAARDAAESGWDGHKA